MGSCYSKKMHFLHIVLGKLISGPYKEVYVNALFKKPFGLNILGSIRINIFVGSQN